MKYIAKPKTMKTTIRNLLTVMLLIAASLQGHAQGFVYDQQVSNTEAPGGYTPVRPVSQSFVPSLSSVGFVQFYLYPSYMDSPTLYVNILYGNPTDGTLMGQSNPVTLTNPLTAVTTFIFPNQIAVVPGTTYYFQLVVQSGGSASTGVVPHFIYTNGMIYFGAVANPGANSWFREGIVQAPQIKIGNFIAQSGNFGFTINGVTNQTVVVEASTNLVDWLPVWTNTLSGASAIFIDSQWTNYPARYYRAR
jgi:hypothetical protein